MSGFVVLVVWASQTVVVAAKLGCNCGKVACENKEPHENGRLEKDLLLDHHWPALRMSIQLVDSNKDTAALSSSSVGSTSPLSCDGRREVLRNTRDV